MRALAADVKCVNLFMHRTVNMPHLSVKPDFRMVISLVVRQ